MKQARLFLFSGFLFFSQILFAMENAFSDKDDPWYSIQIENENLVENENLTAQACTSESKSFFEELQNFTETELVAKTSTNPVDVDENNSFEFIDEKITDESRSKDKELKDKKINYSCKAYDNSIKCNYSSKDRNTFRRHMEIVHIDLTCEKISEIIKKQNPSYKPRLKDKKIIYSCECNYSSENPSSFRIHMKNKHHLSEEKITEEMQKQNPKYKPRNPNYKSKKKTNDKKN